MSPFLLDEHSTPRKAAFSLIVGSLVSLTGFSMMCLLLSSFGDLPLRDHLRLVVPGALAAVGYILGGTVAAQSAFEVWKQRQRLPRFMKVLSGVALALVLSIPLGGMIAGTLTMARFFACTG